MKTTASATIILAALLCIALMGCVASPAEDYASFSNEHFSISHPKDWKVTYHNASNALTIEDQKIMIAVSVVDAAGQTFDQYVDSRKAKLPQSEMAANARDNITSVEISSDEPVSFKGLTGRRLRLLLYFENAELQKEITYLRKDGKIYAIMVFAYEGSFDEEMKRIRPIIDSLNFKVAPGGSAPWRE